MSSPGGALSDAEHRALLRYAVIVHRARAVSVVLPRFRGHQPKPETGLIEVVHGHEEEAPDVHG